MENNKTIINLITLAKFYKDKGNLLKEREILTKAKDFATTDESLCNKIKNLLYRNSLLIKSKDELNQLKPNIEVKNALWSRYPAENRYKATIEIEFDFKGNVLSLDKSPSRILKQLKPKDFLVLALKNRMMVNKVVSVKRLKDKRYLGENYNQLKI